MRMSGFPSSEMFPGSRSESTIRNYTTGWRNRDDWSGKRLISFKAQPVNGDLKSDILIGIDRREVLENILANGVNGFAESDPCIQIEQQQSNPSGVWDGI